MSPSFDKHQKRRLISSYFSVVISITLVLFLLGILGMLIAVPVVAVFQLIMSRTVDKKLAKKNIIIE